MSKKTLIEIDGLKLENAVLSRGITMRFASQELGYSDWFLSNCKSRNTINKAAATGLSNRFGIQLDEYKKTEPEILKVMEEAEKEEQPEAVLESIAFDFEKLGEIIYTAVYEAVKKVWAES